MSVSPLHPDVALPNYGIGRELGSSLAVRIVRYSSSPAFSLLRKAVAPAAFIAASACAVVCTERPMTTTSGCVCFTSRVPKMIPARANYFDQPLPIQEHAATRQVGKYQLPEARIGSNSALRPCLTIRGPSAPTSARGVLVLSDRSSMRCNRSPMSDLDRLIQLINGCLFVDECCRSCLLHRRSHVSGCMH